MFESKATINRWVECGDDYYYGQNGEKIDYEMAAVFYGKAEAKKHPRATFMLALCHEQGKGVDKDTEYAELLYEKAAKLGDADAGKRLKSGKAVAPPAPAANEEEHPDAVGEADSGDTDEDTALALQYFLKKKYKKALPLMRQSAESGNAEAQYYLGLMYVGGNGVPEDFGKAAEWFKKSASQGNTDAQEYLNTLRDYDSAVQEYDKSESAFAEYEKLYEAAKKGDASAAYRLGVMYEKGIDVEADQRSAFVWYSDASDCGTKSEVRARLAIAYMYYEGRGIGQDYAEAYKWFDMANQNIFGRKEPYFPEAHYMLALMEKDGKGTSKSIPMALHHFQTAAKDGHAGAHYELAMLYKNSAGIDDLKAAVVWMEKAAALKQPDAVSCLRAFKANVEKELAEAERKQAKAEQEAAEKAKRVEQEIKDTFDKAHSALYDAEDYATAHKLYEWVASQNGASEWIGKASMMLFRMFMSNVGPIDAKKSISYLRRAADRGEQDAIEAIEEAKKHKDLLH